MRETRRYREVRNVRGEGTEEYIRVEVVLVVVVVGVVLLGRK